MGVLINPVTRSWRNEVVDHVFNVQEVEIVKGIPLSSTNQPDKLIWSFTPSSNYSVKSGYKFLLENSEQFQRPTQDTGFWKKVWGMEIPCKIKNFLWKASREALPVKKKFVSKEDCIGWSMWNLQGEGWRLLTCPFLLFWCAGYVEHGTSVEMATGDGRLRS